MLCSITVYNDWFVSTFVKLSGCSALRREPRAFDAEPRQPDGLHQRFAHIGRRRVGATFLHCRPGSSAIHRMRLLAACLAERRLRHRHVGRHERALLQFEISQLYEESSQ